MIIFESSRVGYLPATKVRVLSGRWRGQTGVVVRVIDGPGTLMVRFDVNDRPIPFGLSEVMVLK